MKQHYYQDDGYNIKELQERKVISYGRELMRHQAASSLWSSQLKMNSLLLLPPQTMVNTNANINLRKQMKANLLVWITKLPESGASFFHKALIHIRIPQFSYGKDTVS